MIDTKTLIGNIRSILEEVRASLPKENIDDANDLLEHAEWGEALSLICTQLFEYDVQISAGIYERSNGLASRWKCQKKNGLCLKILCSLLRKGKAMSPERHFFKWGRLRQGSR